MGVGDIVKLKPNYSCFNHHYKIIKLASIAQLKKEDLQLIAAKKAPKYKLLIRNLQPEFTDTDGHHFGFQDNDLVAEIENVITKSRCFVVEKSLLIVLDSDYQIWKKQQEERSKTFRFPDQPKHYSEQLSFGLDNLDD